MKSPLRQSLSDYLEFEGRLDLSVLGPGPALSFQASRAGVSRLRRSLRRARKPQARIQSIRVLLLCVLFALVAIFLAFDRIALAAGATLLLFPVLWSLRQIGIEIAVTEFLREAAGVLPPQEILNLAEAFYWPSDRDCWWKPEPPEELLSPSPPSEPVAEKISILLLTSDPSNATRLRLDKEAQEILEKLRLAKLSDRFELHQRRSVRPADLSQALLDTRAEIVHFSGHGRADGRLYLENERGEAHPVEPSALAALFQEFRHVRCVLLNACYSEDKAASAVAKHVDYVIGARGRILDTVAIPFSVGFYQALGAGCTIEMAYRLGCVQAQLQGAPESDVPVLVCKAIE